jgi:hypothetical protein
MLFNTQLAACFQRVDGCGFKHSQWRALDGA